MAPRSGNTEPATAADQQQRLVGGKETISETPSGIMFIHQSMLLSGVGGRTEGEERRRFCRGDACI
jgi:hypothetical protein